MEAPEPVVVEVKVNRRTVVHLGLKSFIRGRLCDYLGITMYNTAKKIAFHEIDILLFICICSE